MKPDSDRAEQLFKEKLGAKQDFDSKRAMYEAQKSAVAQAKARLVQSRTQREQTAAQLTSTQRRIALARAGLVRAATSCDKHDS